MIVHIQQTRYTTDGGVVVNRQQSQCDGSAELTRIVQALDTRPGAVFSCEVDYPGRYRRKSLAFINPPLRITSRDYCVRVEALNSRGTVLLPEIHRSLAAQASISCCDIMETRELRVEVLPAAEAAADETEEMRTRRPSVMSVIRHILAHFASDEDSYLGLYGPFGYDLAFQFEPVELQHPRAKKQRDLVLYLPDELIVVDPATGAGDLLRYEFFCRDSHGETQTTGGLKRLAPQTVTEYAAAKVSAKIGQRCDHAPGEYAALVEKAKACFSRGDLFEVVPGQMFSQATAELPSAIFRRLQKANPAPYLALMNLGQDEFLISASPEMYVRVAGRRVESCPISGTIARGRNALEDAELIRELLNSAKDEAELSMCTDVDRNDKSRICEPGSVRVIGRRQPELYSRLIHTVDHVEGRLLPKFDALDAFLAHTWAVTVTGAPKRAAMAFIEQHEKSPRQWYGGAFGRLGFDGSMDTGLTLRTIHLQRGIAHVRAGATLLHDSDPHAEEAETRLKASALLAALQPAKKENTVGAAPQSQAAIKTPNLRALMVDHQDSFVQTLAACFRMQGVDVITLRPEAARRALSGQAFDLVILSPGPGRPADFDCQTTLSLCEQQGLPVFGVCLGLQAMVEYCGGELGVMPTPRHGKASMVKHDGSLMFSGLPPRFMAGRYHSLVASRLPEALAPVAVTDDESCHTMAVMHRTLPWMAVQFHPESILTQQTGVADGSSLTAGDALVRNVVRAVSARCEGRLKPQACAVG